MMQANNELLSRVALSKIGTIKLIFSVIVYRSLFPLGRSSSREWNEKQSMWSSRDAPQSPWWWPQLGSWTPLSTGSLTFSMEFSDWKHWGETMDRHSISLPCRLHQKEQSEIRCAHHGYKIPPRGCLSLGCNCSVLGLLMCDLTSWRYYISSELFSVAININLTRCTYRLVLFDNLTYCFLNMLSMEIDLEDAFILKWNCRYSKKCQCQYG